MKFMVLGGAGYIGSHFVWEAFDLGHDVLVFDHLERGHSDFLPKDVKLTKADVLDTATLTTSIRSFKPDAIMHFAAYALVSESTRDPNMYYQNNVGGVVSLLNAMRAAESKASIIFSSTCAVFGTPTKLPISESFEKRPESPYGQSKYFCEVILEDAAKAYGYSVCALRYFNACGADLSARTGELHNPETHLIPNIFAAARAGRQVTIFGKQYPTRDGTCIRDYIHVKDLAQAHLEVATRMMSDQSSWNSRFEAIHLGTGRGYSNLEVVAAVETALKTTLKVEFAERREGDPAELYADTTKANTMISFVPKYSDLKTIIESVHRWETRKRS